MFPGLLELLPGWALGGCSPLLPPDWGPHPEEHISLVLGGMGRGGESWEQLVQQEEESGASALGGAARAGPGGKWNRPGPTPKSRGCFKSLFWGDLLRSIKWLLAR